MEGGSTGDEGSGGMIGGKLCHISKVAEKEGKKEVQRIWQLDFAWPVSDKDWSPLTTWA